MTRRSRTDDGWVTVVALMMMVISLVLAFAVLAVVDIQGSAARSSQSDSTSYALAESISRDAVATLGGTTMWPQTAAQTPSKDASVCGVNAYGGASDTSPTGVALRSLVAQTLGSSAGTWKVNICRVAAAAEAWSDGYLTSRVAYANYADPAVRDLLWIRAQTTQRGVARSVVLKVRATRAPSPLPSGFAVITGAFGNELATTTGSLTNAGVLGGVTKNILGSSGGIYKDGSSAAKVAVRCGLLTVLASGQVCFTGTVAGVANTTSAIGASGLNTLLGFDRFAEASSLKVASEEQIAEYKAEADNSGTHLTTVGNGQSCFAGLPSDTSGKVVYIDKVGTGAAQKCLVEAVNATTPRKVKLLIIEQGGATIRGKYASASSVPAPASQVADIQGVVYALNHSDANGTVDTSLPGKEIVVIENGGMVDGAVFVDGSGTVRTTPPELTVTSAVCDVLSGTLGTLGVITCKTLSVLGLVDLVNSLTSATDILNVSTLLAGQLTDYTAVSKNSTVIAAAAAQIPASAAVSAGTFRQIAPN